MSTPTVEVGRREAQQTRNLIAHLCDADAHPNRSRVCRVRAAVTVNDLIGLAWLAADVETWAAP